jgi:azurin
MTHPSMIACGISLLHRAKFHRMSKHFGLGLGHHGHKHMNHMGHHGRKIHHMKGMSAVKKDPDSPRMKPAMPRALKFR